MKKTVLAAFIFAVMALGASSGNVSAQAVEPATTPAQPVMVTVEKGDSLSKIANRYETTWPRVFYANTEVENPHLINPGDELRIPTAEEVLKERPLPADRPAPTPAPVAKKQAAAPVKKTLAVAPKKSTTTRTTTASTSYPVSSNAAKAFIYMKESGNNPNATNPTGCYGIGQDCNGVVRNMCGADYDCQDEYFTNYAMRRYGSWEAAYAFWQNNHWW